MIQELFEPVVEFVGYWTGKPIVRILSLGRLHVSLTAESDRAGRRSRRWYSLTFTCGGKRYVDPEVVALIGMIAWAVLIAAIVLLVRSR